MSEDFTEEFYPIEPAWTPGDILYYGASSRSLALYGDVNRSSSLTLISQILELENRNCEPIKIHLNTDGGTLSDALAIYDCLRSVRSPIILIATGVCASAGLLILVAGDLKIATEHTLFFYHQAVLPLEGLSSKAEVMATSTAYDLCQERYDNLLIKRTGIDIKLYKKEFEGKTAKYFTAEEAKNYGLIDEILKPQQKIGKLILEI